MTCAEFQKVLPFIIESGGNAEEEAHRKSCPVCTDLVQDLKYIAEQAKLLVPMEDPAPRVWSGIRSSLEREGLVRPAGAARFRPAAVLRPSHWTVPSRIAAVAAMLAVAAGLLVYQWERGPAPPAQVAQTQPAVTIDADDLQLLDQVGQREPALRQSYEENLKSVNAYIFEAELALKQDPADEDAREHLMLAHEQKAMLYQMALSRFLQ